MGVAGAGKTTVGRALAERLRWSFVDADDLHPAANIARMAAGVALTDGDRAPWLTAVCETIANRLERGQRVVMACSALREQYRAAIRPVDAPRSAMLLVQLDVSRQMAEARLRARAGHYMPASLVGTQLDLLEPPSEGLRLDASLPVSQLVDRIVPAILA